MATNAPAPPPSSNRPPLAPPEERFWIRYSPHQELPLSAASSIALHILVGGLMILAAVYLAKYFGKSSKPIPVESVRFDQGGGGGERGGMGIGHGLGGGGGGRKEAANQGEDSNRSQPGSVEPDPDREHLDTPELKQPPIKLDNTNFRPISTSTNKAYARLNQGVRDSFRPRDPGPGPGGEGDGGKGRGGSGSGGGAGTGTGKGTGSGTGPGKGDLSKREQRMLRWHMLFNTRDGADYLSQLRQLGAILAIPLAEGANTEYGLVRDLGQRPAKVRREDVRKIQRIYWVDDNATNVRTIMAALGLNVTPSHFVAFMPEKLEQKLFEIEKEYLGRHHPGATEDQIQITKFKLRGGPQGLEPYVDTMTLAR